MASFPLAAAPPSRSPRQIALPLSSRVEREFAEWIQTPDGQLVEAEVVHRARLLQLSGIKRWGIASIWEAIRYDRTLQLRGEPRLNNNWRSLMARRVMAQHADLVGFFPTRELRGRW